MDAEDGDLMDLIDAEVTTEATEKNFFTLLDSTQKTEVNIAKGTQRGLKKLSRSQTRLGRNQIILDTGAKVTILRDRDLFGRICESEQPILVNGINEDDQAMLITEEGPTILGRAYYDRRAAANILSFSEAVDNFERVVYNDAADEFVIRVSSHSRALFFRREKYTGMYVCDLDNSGDIYEAPIMVTTVADRMNKYTVREISRAEAARDLQRKFYFLGDATLERLLRKGKIKNTKVSALDVARARDIWGPALGLLKGTSTSRKIPHIPLGEKLRTLQPKNQTIHTDLMYVNGTAYLLSVYDPLEYVKVTRLKAKDEWSLWRALEQHINYPKRFGLEVVKVRVDNESAMASEFFQRKLGDLIDMGGASISVPMVERKIRTVKERIRAVITTLPYNLTEKLEEWLVKGSIYTINLVPTRNSYEFASPREKLHGCIIDAQMDLKHGFGDYCQVHEEDTDNSMRERTVGALALKPTGATDGSWYYWTIRTGKVVRRRRATELPLPDTVVHAINTMAGKRRRWRAKDSHIRFDKWQVDDGIVLDEEMPVVNEPEVIDREFVMPELVVDDDEEEDDHDESEDGNNQDDNGSIQSETAEQQRQQLIHDIFGYDTDEENGGLDAQQMEVVVQEQQDAIEEDASTAGESQQYGRGFRARRLPDGHWARVAGAARLAKGAIASPDNVYGLKMSVNQGVREFGYEAVLSVVKEMKQMVDSDVFEGVESAKLSPAVWKDVINSMLFMKEKFSADGMFQKLKSRLVAGGHMMDRSIYKEASSPTAATQSVLMVAAIAAMTGRAVAAVDVPGAFLKATMPDDEPPVLMKLDKFLTSVLVKLDNSFQQYVRHDGTCVVRLKKALYGCIQSAKAWFDKLTADLKGLGFLPNPTDPCVFNRTEENGQQTTIVAHVDDLMVTGANETTLDSVIQQLDNLYTEGDAKITVQRGRRIEYIGMVFVFNSDKTVSITMDGFVCDFLLGVEDIPGTDTSPASKNLFNVRADAAGLDAARRERFHSIMAKILYLAKRVRPDLLVSVAYLVRRVQCCNEDDWDKMCRLVRYIRGSRTLGIRLAGDGQLSITAYIDASYGVHHDMKSHTGAMITLGRGPVYSKSTVQRLNTTSSAEAELVALADSAGQVLWTREFLQHQGYSVGPAVIKEDNQSAIQLVNNGRSNSARTRHIAVRFYFISDRIKSGEIVIEYLETSEMIADILTKPMIGAQFLRLRTLLLNWPEEP